MSNKSLDTTRNNILHDNENKLWKSIVVPIQPFPYQSLAEVLLSSLRSHEPQSILEYHYHLDKGKTANEIHYESIIFANYLQGLGVKKGDVIVVFSVDNYQISAITAGCCLLGAVVNFFEVNLENEYIDCTFELLGPKVILYEAKWHSKIQKSLERQYPSTLQHLICIDGEQFTKIIENNKQTDLENFKCAKVLEPQQEVAMLVLTSGSTGNPKVVQISHALFLHALTTWWYSSDGYEVLNTDTRLLSFSPLRWMSQISNIFQSLIFGAKRICVSKQLEPKEFPYILQRTQVTHLFATPTLFYSLLLEMDKENTKCFSSLRFIQVAGERPFLALMQLIRKLAPQAKTFYAYGMSEISGSMCSDAAINGGCISPGFQVQILDEQMRPLDTNQAGQMALKALYPLLGYKSIDNTRYFTANGFFLNGDYAFVDDNHKLHIEARYKDLIKAPHRTIIPCDIEGFVNELPEIFTSVVCGYRLQSSEPYDKAALFVVLRSRVTANSEDITKKIYNHLKQNLNADDVKVIEDIYIKDQLPLNCCGKTHRELLKLEAVQRKQSV